MDLIDRGIALLKFRRWRDAVDAHDAELDGDTEAEMEAAWIEWRDQAEEHGLCLQCGATGTTETAYCDRCDETKESK